MIHFHKGVLRRSFKMFKKKHTFLFNKEEKKLLQRNELCNEGKVHIKKKGKVHVMNFSDKGKVDITDFWEQK